MFGKDSRSASPDFGKMNSVRQDSVGLDIFAWFFACGVY